MLLVVAGIAKLQTQESSPVDRLEELARDIRGSAELDPKGNGSLTSSGEGRNGSKIITDMTTPQSSNPGNPSTNQTAKPSTGVGRVCVVDFYSASVMDKNGFAKMPTIGERCELLSGSLNPFVTGRYFKEFLNSRCIEFIVADPTTITILGYC